MPKGKGPTLTERRAEELRLSIARTARDIFIADGDTTATVERICAEVGIATRTFYRHFPVKEDVLGPLFRRSEDHMRGLLARAAADSDPVDVLVQAQPGGARQLRFFQPNGNVSYYTADTKMFLKDESGDVEVSTKDGKRILLAHDAKGAVLFEGPIDTDEQRKTLPEEIRKKLDSIQVRATARTSAIEAPAFLHLEDSVQ